MLFCCFSRVWRSEAACSCSYCSNQQLCMTPKAQWFCFPTLCQRGPEDLAWTPEVTRLDQGLRSFVSAIPGAGDSRLSSALLHIAESVVPKQQTFISHCSGSRAAQDQVACAGHLVRACFLLHTWCFLVCSDGREQREARLPPLSPESTKRLLPQDRSDQLPEAPALNANVDFRGHRHLVCCINTDH